MRILHLTTFVQGGAGLAIAGLATAQARAGHDVAVVTSRTGVSSYGNYPRHLETLTDGGVQVHLVDSLFDRSPSASRFVLKFLRTDPAFAEPFEIIHAHAAVPSRIGLALAEGERRTRVLQTMHGWGLSKSADQQQADIEVLRSLQRVVVPGQASADLLAGFGVNRSRIRVIHYGIEVTATDETNMDVDRDLARLRIERGCGRPVICCVGTIGERKNQQLLVEALALLAPNVRPMCAFVGDGPLYQLREYVRALRLAPYVRCVGYKPHARAFLKLADWMVLPSRSEGMPLSILEAFADQVPVIASDIPEIRELVEDGTSGLLFKSDSAEALAARLRDALAMTGQARHSMTQTARAIYLGRHQMPKMVRAYWEQYEQLLARPAVEAMSCAG